MLKINKGGCCPPLLLSLKLKGEIKMKKFALLLTVIFTFALSALCFAADGDALNKQQATAEVFVNVFTENAPAYTTFTAGFDDNLKSKINRQAYLTLQQQVKERFGTVKESKFYSYQRFDERDYVTYIAAFTKEKLVNITCIFNKNNQMVDFALSPIREQKAEQK